MILTAALAAATSAALIVALIIGIRAWARSCIKYVAWTDEDPYPYEEDE